MDDVRSHSKRRLATILKDPKHPLHSAAKAELDRRGMQSEGAMKRIATTQSNKADRMASTDKKGLETFKKFRKKMNEKTLTPAEKKKREEIAKSMERDNPGMPMAKKMAIATATAKRVAEDWVCGNCNCDPCTCGEEINEVSREKLFKYMHKSAADVPKARGDARRQDKRIGGQKMADDKVRAAQGKRDAAHIKVPATEETVNEVLDTPKAMDSYRNKAKYSKDRATSSAAAKILRGPDKDGKRADHSPELKTMNKRDKGLKMADNLAGRKTLAKLRKEEAEQIDELSTQTMKNYIRKAGDDRAKNAYEVGKTGKLNTKGLKRRQGINRALNKLTKEGKAYGPTGVSYYVPSGHKDEVDPKTGKKYPERQKPGYKAPTNEEKDTHVTKDGRTAKKGLWYYMNKRKKAGTSRPKSAGTVDPKMMKKSQE